MTAPRRERKEKNIYLLPNGGYEIGYRDTDGRQRWRRVKGGLMAARELRDKLLAARGRRERPPGDPRISFGDAADHWLDKQVSGLRPATQAIYRSAVDVHLRPRWGRRRLDSIEPDDAADLVRELRAAGKSEWTISGVLKAASRVFRHAARRGDFYGDPPTQALDPSERPHTGQTARRRLFSADELTATLVAAHEPCRTLFALAAAQRRTPERAARPDLGRRVAR